jgi:hypothetical protein
VRPSTALSAFQFLLRCVLHAAVSRDVP